MRNNKSKKNLSSQYILISKSEIPVYGNDVICALVKCVPKVLMENCLNYIVYK